MENYLDGNKASGWMLVLRISIAQEEKSLMCHCIIVISILFLSPYEEEVLVVRFLLMELFYLQ